MPERPQVQGFLLDESRSPRLRAGFGEGGQVIHAREPGTNPTDLELWTYAEQHALVIVTKDAEFTDRVLLTDAPCGSFLNGSGRKS